MRFKLPRNLRLVVRPSGQVFLNETSGSRSFLRRRYQRVRNNGGVSKLHDPISLGGSVSWSLCICDVSENTPVYCTISYCPLSYCTLLHCTNFPIPVYIREMVGPTLPRWRTKTCISHFGLL